MKLSDVSLETIYDSRGNETLKATMHSVDSPDVISKTSVPHGGTRGSYEAAAISPSLANEKLQSILPKLTKHDFRTQEEFDQFLIELDGTDTKRNLGGNLLLALSFGWARLNAKATDKELYEYISDQINAYQTQRGFLSRKINLQKPRISTLPRMLFSMIDGGFHAVNTLSFQEFHIVPEVEDPLQSIGFGREYYQKLNGALESRFGKNRVSHGDEGGFSAPFRHEDEAFETLERLIISSKHPIRISVDAAASQLYQVKSGKYQIGDALYSTGELHALYLKFVDEYNLRVIEDPFHEDAYDAFAALQSDLRGRGKDTLVVADDLTATNLKRLQRAIEYGAGNTVLVKPDQIGTLTESLDVIRFAHRNGWKTIVSHRSGETMDDFIADLAAGAGAWGLKAGPPTIPERAVKYERLLRIASLMER